LFNGGNIVSVDTNDVETDPAVEFPVGGAVVVNQAGAHTVGSYDGFNRLGGTASVTNAGDIAGVRDIGIVQLSMVGHDTLGNSGSVFGAAAAAEVTASLLSETWCNFGGRATADEAVST
jgi:hypothetical protein